MKAKQKMYKGKEALLIRGLCAKGLFSKGKTGKPSVLELHFSLHKTHTISLLLTRSNAYNNSNSIWWNNEKQEHRTYSEEGEQSDSGEILGGEAFVMRRGIGATAMTTTVKSLLQARPTRSSFGGLWSSSGFFFRAFLPHFLFSRFRSCAQRESDRYSLFQFLYVSRYSDSILRKMTMVLDWKPKERLLRLLFLFAERTRKKERDSKN